MAIDADLVAVAIIEKDSNGDVLWTWSYPAISTSCRDVVLRKCCLNWEGSGHEILPICFGQFNKQWYYIITSNVCSNDLPKVAQVSLVLIAKEFNPEKYHNLGDILTKTYTKTGNASSILQLYLSVFTKGSCSDGEENIFQAKNFDCKKAYINAPLKGIINLFGVESILIYTALLLKKKIAVYSPKVDALLNFTRALPLFVWYRQNWNILHPFVHLEPEELEGLGSSYVAGFTNASVEDKTNLYDLFVNVATGEISIAPHAKECFQMGKIHKDVAMLLVESAKDDEKDEQTIIKELSVKTKDIITNLKSLAVEDESGQQKITLEALRQRKLTTAMENFLFNLAAAEGLV